MSDPTPMPLAQPDDLQSDPEHRDLTTDAPIVDFAADRFARGPFARRIAKTIMAQRDPNSLVVGIYGPWGDGKTSVLNLVEQALTADDSFIAVRFNPWQLGDEYLVFHGFFETVASALDAKLTSGTARAGTLLKQYGALLKPIPFAGDAASALVASAGTAMSAGSTDLGAQKKRIDRLLGESGKRVVILMDDLDRLDKSEIQVIFRLVKVAADFQHTAYVLAFDDAVVSAALADRYATGSIHGVNFLEKIVQLPLHLPPVRDVELRQLTLETVDAALNQAEIELPQAEINRFVSTFQRAITPRLKTPRVGKRYGNAAMFALPMIGDETNPVDLLLIEAMRIFYPPLYEWVRGNRAVVLGSGSMRTGEALGALVRSGFETATAGLQPDAQAGAKTLLTHLFPRTESAWQNKSWLAEWDAIWAKSKRIASTQYFDRYFTYAIPIGDISDADLDGLVALFASDVKRDEAIAAAESMLATADDAFITKLVDRLDSVNPTVAGNAAFVLGAIGEDLSNRSGFLQMSSMERMAMLVSKLLKQMEPTDRFELATALVRACERLTWAIELFRWMEVKSDPTDGEEAVDSFDVAAVGAILAARIGDYWRTDPRVDALESRTGASLYIWKTHGDADAMTTYWTARIDTTPADSQHLIATFLGRAWDHETGVPVGPDFHREEYAALGEYVPAGVLFAALQIQFGEGIGEGDFHLSESMTGERALAHQFGFIHRKAISETIEEANALDPSASSDP